MRRVNLGESPRQKNLPDNMSEYPRLARRNRPATGGFFFPPFRDAVEYSAALRAMQMIKEFTSSLICTIMAASPLDRDFPTRELSCRFDFALNFHGIFALTACYNT